MHVFCFISIVDDVMIDDCDKVNNKGQQREASTKSDERHGVKRPSDVIPWLNSVSF